MSKGSPRSKYSNLAIAEFEYRWKNNMNHASEKRICQNCKKDFIIEPEDFNFYEKIKVPPPTWCSECRMIRRKIFRNEKSLYHKKCELCKKNTISMYPENSPFKIYCHQCWWSDKWDRFSFGKDYDWSKPFLVQFKELMLSVPRVALVQYHQNINSEFNNSIADCKNTYLSNSCTFCENVAYGANIDKSRDTLDSTFIKNSELCFENIDSSENNNCLYLLRSRSCLDCSYLFDCVNCKDCFMSSNLRNKQFVFCNLQFTKDEYFKKIAEIQFGSHKISEKLKKEYLNLITSSLHKFANLIKTINCNGDNISNSKNVYHSFNIYNAENMKYSTRSLDTRDSYDTRGSINGELLYEVMAPGFSSSRTFFCIFGEQTLTSNYSDWCHNSSNLFACVGLRNKKYCILNKQYTKEQYEELIPKIIQHMNDMPYIDAKGRVYKYGEFFPPELSPFCYNETIAQEYFPLTKEEALKQGYKWKEKEARNYSIDIKTKDIPDNIKEVDESIINKVIECEHQGTCNEQCTEAFKIIPPELQFYQRMNLPLPHLCPNCRHYQRIKQRNPLKLWHRKCMCGSTGSPQVTSQHFHGVGKCEVEFETSYAPERPEIVYCERCYQAEVY